MLCRAILLNQLKCIFTVFTRDALWCQVCNSPAMLHSCRTTCHQDDGRGGRRRRERAQLMACWWPDCSGPAAHWAVIATAGASGTDSSGAPIAQSWHLPLSTVCPDQPLMMPFVLTDGKTEVWNQPISSSTDLSFLLSPLAHPSIIFNLTFSLCVSIFSVLPYYLFLPSLSLHLIHLSASRAQSTSAFSIFFLQLFHPSPRRSHSFIWIASTLEGIIR